MINEGIHHAFEAKTHTHKHAHKHCISIGKIPTCQPSQPQPPHSHPWYCFTGWESFGPFGFVVIKKFSLYFILLFVGKHLKEIEGLNGRRVCIHPAVQKDCMEEQPICWEAGWGWGGALARECHRAGPDWGPKVEHSPDFVGSTFDKKTKRVFFCDADGWAKRILIWLVCCKSKEI